MSHPDNEFANFQYVFCSSGVYLSGNITVLGSSNLVASNIKSGVNIFGVTGTYTGSTPSTAVRLNGNSEYDGVITDGYLSAPMDESYTAPSRIMTILWGDSGEYTFIWVPGVGYGVGYKFSIGSYTSDPGTSNVTIYDDGSRILYLSLSSDKKTIHVTGEGRPASLNSLWVVIFY